MMKPEKVWQKLVGEIQTLPLNATRSDYYKFLSQWVKRNQEAIGKTSVEKFGLLELAELNPDDYAIQEIGTDVSLLRSRIEERSPNSADVIAMFIRDDLESLIVYKAARRCSNCESVEMGVWKHVEKGVVQLIYICDLCSFAECENGKPYTNGKLVIATKADLKTKGLIK